MAPHDSSLRPQDSLPLGLIVTLGIAHAAFAGVRFAITLHAAALQATPLAIGTLLGLVMVVPMLAAVRIGRWSDRLGFRPFAIGGFALLLASCLVVAVWPHMPSLYVASVLSGTGYMSAHVAVNLAIGRASAAHRRTDAFSAMAIAFSLSGFAGPMLAGATIDVLGHRWAYLALSAFPLVSLLLLCRVAPRRVGAHAPPSAQAPARIADLFAHPPLRAVFVVSGLLSMGWDLFTFLAPLQGVRAGLSATLTGLVMGAFSSGTFAIRLLLPRISRGVGEWATMGGALLVTSLGYLAFPLLSDFGPLVLAAFLLGMSLGCGQPVSMALVHSHSPGDRAGEAVGLRSTITSASQTFLPMLFGALGTAVGMAAVFWAVSALLAAGGAFAIRRR
ncbi:MFS transporter [Xenophilus arseniciresistens]|uniref:MFS transporter n=1 Tax=Xenophilus arseniciresistens TaxID=1283306 RepID=A0AAE3NDF0_9BURK|nr:MFS transporter [Xenophilus arseniciresistens]MDA7419004.1 MFS transporter [Xenophilus arseniciresistens]